MTSYFIDPDNGSGSNDGLTPGTAFSSIGQFESVASSGDDVTIYQYDAGGWFNEQIHPPVSNLTYAAATGETPKIQGTGSATYSVYLTQDFTTLTGLQVLNVNEQTKPARTNDIQISSNNNTITDCIVHNDIAADTDENTNNVRHQAVVIGGADNVITGLDVSEVYIAAVFRSSGRRNRLTQSNLNDCYEMTVVWGGNSPVVAQGHVADWNNANNNYSEDIFQCVSLTWGTLDVVGLVISFNKCGPGFFYPPNVNFNEQAIDLKGGYHVLAEGNIIFDMAQTAIIRGHSPNPNNDPPALSQHQIYRNNVLYGNQEGAAAYSNEYYFYHNDSVYNRGDHNGVINYTGFTLAPLDNTDTSTYLGFRNNISVNHTSTNPTYELNLYMGQKKDLDYNLYYSPSGQCEFKNAYGGTTYTLGGWRTAVSGEANSVEADPQFNSFGGSGYTPSGDPDTNSYDWGIATTSPAYDAAGPLTRATNSGSGSTSLTVGNSLWFFDRTTWGNPQSPSTSDVIKIGSSAPVTISSINYSTNTITLSEARTWSNNDGVYWWPYDVSTTSGVLNIGVTNWQGAGQSGSSGGSTPPPSPTLCTGATSGDLFTDTSGVLLQNHVPDLDVVGNGWNVDGTIDIQGNKARISAANQGAWIDSGSNNYSIEMTFNPGGADNRGAIVVRHSGDAGTPTSGYFLIVKTGAGQVNLSRLDGGSPSILSSYSTTIDNTATYTLKLDANRDTITAYLNGTQIAQVIDSTYQNAQNVGFVHYTWVNDAARFDDLCVIADTVSTPTTSGGLIFMGAEF